MIPRVGIPRPGVFVVEFPIDSLIPLHPVPRAGTPPNHIRNLADSIRQQGYDVAYAIPVAKFSDGRHVLMGGHHRTAAMKLLGETTIPSRIVDWSSISLGARQLYRQQFPEFPWEDEVP